MVDSQDVGAVEVPAQPGFRRAGEPSGCSPEEDPDRWFRAVRRFIRCSATLNLVYRGVVAVVGFGVVVLGLLLIPLPGPGWLIVFAGLAVLATEFEWAARLLRYARRQVQAWSRWVQRQSPATRVVLGMAGVAVLAGVVWWYVNQFGVPEWLASIG